MPPNRIPDNTATNWKSLYKIGGLSALIPLVYSLVTMIILITIGGQPVTAREGFAMLGVILMMIAGPLYLVWFPLLARDFFRLIRSDT